jgi:flagellar FliL protein
MKTSRWIVLVALTGALTAAAGGAGAWWVMRTHGAAKVEGEEAAASEPAKVDKRPQKFVSLDKVVVMLRRADGDPASHYLAIDLVLRTPDEHEKATKDELPMLRSVALKALSSYTADKAGAMSIDDFAGVINTAYTERYAQEQRDKPFSEAMIGKLIIE